MGSEVWVHLEITNFHFSIGGEHYYGKLVGDVGDEYTHVKLEHALTAKQAAYLNKKDGATCSFGRVRKGDKTALRRFLTQDWEDTKDVLLKEAAKWNPQTSKPAEAPKDAQTTEASQTSEAPKNNGNDNQKNIFT
ncbi:hypothetical protein LCGC14_3168200 [marine sediment metagenome]|uniref:Uncharacterized protein n=1 Tax=marine sediment metagenome TaxID=412755 RepID=A0A0F8W5V1_9ZZZZ